jgi:hypothetical protein
MDIVVVAGEADVPLCAGEARMWLAIRRGFSVSEGSTVCIDDRLSIDDDLDLRANDRHLLGIPLASRLQARAPFGGDDTIDRPMRLPGLDVSVILRYP